MVRDTLRDRWEKMDPFHLDWIQVEVSARCVGDCRYCPVSRLAEGRQGGFLSQDTFSRLLPHLPAADLVHLQGWGEPLLHPDFWSMARQVGDAGSRVGFTTNGVLLDEGNRRALLESPVEVVGVSLAGTRAATHEHFRGGCPFSTLDGNLRALKAEGEQRGLSRPRLHLAFLLMASNLEEFPEIVSLGSRWGASQIVVSPLSLVLDGEMERESMFTRPDLWPRARELLREARSEAEEAGVAFHAHGWEAREALPSCPENVLRSCYVSSSGEVSPCVMTNLGLREEEAAIHFVQERPTPLHPLSFGNLVDASLEEIWQSAPARAFRRAFRHRIWKGTRGRQGLPAPCGHCYKLFES